MKFNKFVEWAFYAILSGAAVTSVSILSRLSDSVSTLNIQVATILEKSNWIQKSIDDHDSRLKVLENKQH